MTILVATTNPGKQLEYQKSITLTCPFRVTLTYPQDLKISEKPEETGKTFAENSLIKAEFYSKKSRLPTLADDGGIEIPVLNNEPGVLSRRWSGYEATDEVLIDYTISKLKNYKTRTERRASLVVCITYLNPQTKEVLQVSEKIDGYISDQIYPNYIKGYPYRALFIVSGINKYYDELSAEEHETYNHRRKALNKLWKKIYSVH